MAYGVEGLSGDVALEAAHDLSFAEPFLGSTRDVGAGGCVPSHSQHGDHVQPELAHVIAVGGVKSL